MADRLAPTFCGFHSDFENFSNFSLADHFGNSPGSEYRFIFVAYLALDWVDGIIIPAIFRQYFFAGHTSSVLFEIRQKASPYVISIKLTR
jgi:hypothetical protein